MIIIIDNYDSFVYNLHCYIEQLGTSTEVYRNDKITVEEIRNKNPEGIVLSPGPGHPANPRDFGVCADVIEQLSEDIPVFGVCLGHQGMCHHFGGNVIRAEKVMHGKQDIVIHEGRGLFAGIGNNFPAGRYHSLVVKPETLPDCFNIDARTRDGEIMAVSHKTRPLYGVQFHPESVLTPDGYMIIKNFIAVCKNHNHRSAE